jgi:nucleoside-diphosphate-sugar epimerase
VKIIECAEKIFAITQFRPREIFFDRSKPVGVYSRAADLTLTRAKLDWEPRVSVDEGLRRTIDWYYRANKVEDIAERLGVLLTER